MDPREFCDLAEKLANCDSSAHCRTAISRAYYAVFNVAVKMLEAMGFAIARGPKGHDDVKHRLFYSGDREVQRIGHQLADLASDRVKADYRLDEQGVERQATARQKVQAATHMIETLDKACQDSERRDKLVKGISKYDNTLRPKTLG